MNRAIIESTAARYHAAGRFARHYVAAKLRHDPVVRALLALGAQEPFGDVLDIGCGRGQLSLALLQAGVADSVTGLDWNAVHVAQAMRAGRGLRFSASVQDLARDPAIPPADTVLLIDVLYQLDTATQGALLTQATRAARARILIRTPDPDRGLRSAVTRGLEILARRLWPHSGARVNAQPIAAITETLTRASFTVEQTPCWQGTPFANILLIARKYGDANFPSPAKREREGPIAPAMGG